MALDAVDVRRLDMMITALDHKADQATCSEAKTRAALATASNILGKLGFTFDADGAEWRDPQGNRVMPNDTPVAWGVGHDLVMKVGYYRDKSVTFLIGCATSLIAIQDPNAPPAVRNMCLKWKPVTDIPQWVHDVLRRPAAGSLRERIDGLEVRDKNNYELIQGLDARVRKMECPTLPADETMEKLKAHADRLCGGHYEPKNDHDAELAGLIYDVVNRVKDLGKAPKVKVTDDGLDPKNPLDALALLFRSDPYMSAAVLASKLNPMDFYNLDGEARYRWRAVAKDAIWKSRPVDAPRKDTDLKPGDLVHYTIESGCHLRSGGEGYSAAVLVSLDPPMLVSPCGDMVWTSTIELKHLRSNGVAPASVLIAVMDRLRRDLRAAQDRVKGQGSYDDAMRRFPGLYAILSERVRQVEREGFSESHDNDHDGDQLALAAVCYATPPHLRPQGVPPTGWPWAAKWWKPGKPTAAGAEAYSAVTCRMRELEKAGALIAAEIDRLKTKA